MKTTLLSLLMALWLSSGLCQADTSLQGRLQVFMDANLKMDFNKVLNYTYPKLFTIASRQDIMDGLKSTFNNPMMTVKLLDTRVDSIYPVFSVGNGNYAKILFSLTMTMKLKTDSLSRAEQKDANDKLLAGMRQQYPGQSVSIDSTGVLHLYVKANMAAIKDYYAKNWCFINLKDGDPFNERLFNREVLDKFAKYK